MMAPIHYSDQTTFEKIFWTFLDQRRYKYVSINPFTVPVTLTVTKYIAPQSGFPADNVCLVRLEEMYLDRAESDVNLNNYPEAYSDYNTILNRAWVKL